MYPRIFFDILYNNNMDHLTLQKLADVSLMMADNKELYPLLDYAMTIALELVGAERGYLILLEPDNVLNFKVGRDRIGNPIEQSKNEISNSIIQYVFNEGESIIINNAVESEDYKDADSVGFLRLKSVICVPLSARGEIIGVIFAENRSKTYAFAKEDGKSMEFFASLAAIAIQNLILQQNLENRVYERTAELNTANGNLIGEIEERKLVEAKLHELAITDPLTKVANRRRFFELAEENFSQALVKNHALTTILIDIDYFKKVNDEHGHRTGDFVLREFARLCAEFLGEENLFARYGGEEFAVLLPGKNLQEGYQIAEGLRGKITETIFKTGFSDLKITISAGVAALNRERDSNLDDLLDYADQALYQSKRDGRNQVSMWGQLE